MLYWLTDSWYPTGKVGRVWSGENINSTPILGTKGNIS